MKRLALVTDLEIKEMSCSGCQPEPTKTCIVEKRRQNESFNRPLSREAMPTGWIINVL